MSAYRHAPEVEGIILDCVARWHMHLVGLPLISLTKNEWLRKSNRTVMATASLVKGRPAFLAMFSRGWTEWVDDPWTFVIEVSFPAWNILSPEQRVALIDHELEHCKYDAENGRPWLAPHDLEEFVPIVHRHGAWVNDIQHFLDAAAVGAQDAG